MPARLPPWSVTTWPSLLTQFPRVVTSFSTTNRSPDLMTPVATSVPIRCRGRRRACDAVQPGPSRGALSARSLPSHSWLRLLADHAVPQHADRLNLQLDQVPWVQVPVQLKSAPAADRPGAEQVAGIDGFAP